MLCSSKNLPRFILLVLFSLCLSDGKESQLPIYQEEFCFMVLLQVCFNQWLIHLELVLSSFLRAFPDSPSHSNAASRYCHSTVFTHNSLNFIEISAKQVNILHSSLNQVFGFKMQVYFMPPKSYNQSRTSLEIRTPV